MTKVAQYAVRIAWITVFSAVFAVLWLTYPDFLPELPAPVAEYVTSRYGSQTAGVEFFVAFSCSLPFVILFALLSWRIKHRRH